jgi:hypothetical protein
MFFEVKAWFPESVKEMLAAAVGYVAQQVKSRPLRGRTTTGRRRATPPHPGGRRPIERGDTMIMVVGALVAGGGQLRLSGSGAPTAGGLVRSMAR